MIRHSMLAVLRIFYPQIIAADPESLPAHGPLLIVANHPNGLLDPLVLVAALDRPVRFLAKADFFDNPVGRWAMQSFGAIPVYRRQDKAPGGTPSRDANEQTFARCRELLAAGGELAIFPEGTTHSDPALKPLRTGAARIALGAEAASGFTLGLQIVPVGLWYNNKTIFRSSALVTVGKPLLLHSYRELFATDERAAVQALTTAIDAALDTVVIQAETRELFDGIPVLARWVGNEQDDLATQHARATKMLHAYQHLMAADPQRLDDIARAARSYAEALRVLGVANPWELEETLPTTPAVALRLATLLVLAPLATLGWLLNYAPYRLAGTIAHRYSAGDTSIQATVGLIAGVVLLPLAWLLVALLVGLWQGFWWSLLALLIAPLAGYIAARWGEAFAALRSGLASLWLRRRHQSLAQGLVARRRALAAEIAGALDATAGR